MSTLLDALYKEYNELKQKIDKVSDLIVSYGGKIPTSRPDFILSSQGSYKSTTKVYPDTGTWKEKIMYALEDFNNPATAKMITMRLIQLEPEMSEEHIHNMVTQYTSAMARAGEIMKDDSDFRHKYFIRSTE